MKWYCLYLCICYVIIIYRYHTRTYSKKCWTAAAELGRLWREFLERRIESRGHRGRPTGMLHNLEPQGGKWGQAQKLHNHLGRGPKTRWRLHGSGYHCTACFGPPSRCPWTVLQHHEFQVAGWTQEQPARHQRARLHPTRLNCTGSRQRHPVAERGGVCITQFLPQFPARFYSRAATTSSPVSLHVSHCLGAKDRPKRGLASSYAAQL